MGAMASQITSLAVVYSTVYSDPDQRRHRSSASLAFVQGIQRGPVNSPHKGPVTRIRFPFDDVIMIRIPLNCVAVKFIWMINCAVLKVKVLQYRHEMCTWLSLCCVAMFFFFNFPYILQGYFTGTGSIIWSLECRCSNPDKFWVNVLTIIYLFSRYHLLPNTIVTKNVNFQFENQYLFVIICKYNSSRQSVNTLSHLR